MKLLLLLISAVLCFATVRSQDCALLIDVCFVVDSSGSIRDNNPDDGSYDNWDLVLRFIQSFIDDPEFVIAPDLTQFGAVRFSNNAERVFYLDQFYNKNDLKLAVQNMGYIGGRTNTADAMDVTRTQCFGTRGDRPNAPNIAVVITDGVPTLPEDPFNPSNNDAYGRAAAIDAANNLKAAGTYIFAIGITNDIDENLLSAISSPPQQEGVSYFSSPDFQQLHDILEDIVEQACQVPTPAPVTPPPECEAVVDIVFILDQSGSITWSDQENWNRMLSFVTSIVDAFPITPSLTRIGAVKFSTNAQRVFYLDSYTDSGSVKNAINNIVHEGGDTNIAAGLQTMRTQVFNQRGDRFDVKNIAIMVTDGHANIDANRVEAEANLAKDSPNDIEIFAIGITTDVDVNELRLIASEPDDRHVFTVQDFSRLEEILQQVIDQTCASATTLPPTTISPTRPPAPGCLGDDADVVFILDASGSIGEQNFAKIREFVRDVVDHLDVESGRIRVGVETFSDSTRLEFHLNQYSSRAQIIDDVMNIVYTRGTTNTADAIRYARENMFSSNNGDRSNVRDLMIILTDGESNDQAQTLDQAALARAEGIHIVSVGIGSWLDPYELQAIASYPTENNYIHVNDYDAIGTITLTIRDAICDNNNECASNPCRNGATCHNEVRYYWCECLPGYSGPNCADRCDTSGDIVFALDASGSIGQANFQKMVDFLVDVVERLDIDNANSGSSGTRVGLLLFSNNAEPQFHLNDYLSKTEILNALNVRYTGGTTNTADAIRYIRENMFRSDRGDRGGIQNYIVVLTDGRSNDRDSTWQQAMQARAEGATILAIGIGAGVDQMELQGIASAPVDSNVFNVDNFDALNSILDRLGEGLCDNDNECNSNPCRNGAFCTDLVNGYTCTPCPSGYTGTFCERRCDGIADVVFVVDSSGSIRSERFPIVLDFIASIIANLDVGQDRTRVGMVYWSDSAQMGFNLNQYYSQQDVIMAVRRTPFIGGRTNTASALQMILNEIFQSSRGDRSDAPNYALIITDGNSNINPERTIPQAVDDRIAGIHIIVTAVGTDINRLELEGMASAPKSENVFTLNSINELNNFMDDLIDSICDDENECNSNPCRNGGRCVDSLKRYICFCNPDYAGYNCERRCTRQIDVSLILDLSGSVEEVYRMSLDFAKEIVYGLDMQFDRVRIAALAYSTTVTDIFYFNDYQNKEAVINALDFYREGGGKTNTQEALRVMRTDIYTSSRGERFGVRDVAILVSDGYPTINEFNTVPEANQAKNQGIDIFSVAISDAPNMAMMNDISSDPDSEYVYRISQQSDVTNVANQVLDRLCQ